MGAVVVHADDVESPNGVFRGLSGPLGVSGFRVNRLELPAGGEGPEHDHASTGQEEVYAIVAGSGILRLGDEEIALRPRPLCLSPT